MWRPLQLLKKWENSKRGIITGSLGCQNSPICHVKVCYDYISQASPPIDYPTKNCSRQQQGDKFFSLFVYITCYFVIDHLNVIGWLNVDHSVFQKEELWLALIYVCSNCIPFYIIYVSLVMIWFSNLNSNKGPLLFSCSLAFRNTHSAFVLDMNHAPYIKSECLDWKVSVRGSEVASQ